LGPTQEAIPKFWALLSVVLCKILDSFQPVQ